MTPTQVAALTALADIIQRISTWKPWALVVGVAFLPDIIFIVIICLILWKWDVERKELRRQVAEAVSRYDNNAMLVDKVTTIAESLQDIVVLNTSVMQQVNDAITANQWCPLVKKEGKVTVEVKQG